MNSFTMAVLREPYFYRGIVNIEEGNNGNFEKSDIE